MGCGSGIVSRRGATPAAAAVPRWFRWASSDPSAAMRICRNTMDAPRPSITLRPLLRRHKFVRQPIEPEREPCEHDRIGTRRNCTEDQGDLLIISQSGLAA